MKIKNEHKQRPFIDTVIAEMSQLSLSPHEECESETCEHVRSNYVFLECVDEKVEENISSSLEETLLSILCILECSYCPEPLRTSKMSDSCYKSGSCYGFLDQILNSLFPKIKL